MKPLIVDVLQVLLMILIAMTGNYNFFNWVTIVLALPLVDDTYLRWWLGKRTAAGELSTSHFFMSCITTFLKISVCNHSHLCPRHLFSDTGEDDAASWPVIGQFWRPIRWTLNILVYGGIIFWSIRLFALQFRRTPLSIESKMSTYLCSVLHQSAFEN